MEQQQYLIDSNSVINYLGEILPATGMDFMNSVIDNVPNVSVITKIEILGFNAPLEHYQLLSNIINDYDKYDIIYEDFNTSKANSR